MKKVNVNEEIKKKVDVFKFIPFKKHDFWFNVSLGFVLAAILLLVCVYFWIPEKVKTFFFIPALICIVVSIVCSFFEKKGSD